MGKMAIASLTRKATEAAASFPSTVMRFLDMNVPPETTKDHKRRKGSTVRIASNKAGEE
jgi:hypothetical protein